MGVVLDAERIRLGFEELVDGNGQVTEVLFGPFDLMANRDEFFV